MNQDRIVVLDFGGQYTHLIANRIRRLNVYSEIKSPISSQTQLKGAKGIILSGGPSSVYDLDQPEYNPDIFDLGLPMLGICYGHQLIAKHFGGEVRQAQKREYGTADFYVNSRKELLNGINDKEKVWVSHGDVVIKTPPGFEVLGHTESCPIAAMGDTRRKIYGFQFHPEVTHTPCGIKLLQNFIRICGIAQDWNMERYISSKIEELRQIVGKRNVFLLTSGGVDSTVSFALLEKALGPQRVWGFLIDNGFMRKNEVKEVERYLKNYGNLRVFDASVEFLRAVEGVSNPEEKRRIIGDVFIRVQNRIACELGLNEKDWVLGQGTIYPDTIESGGTKGASTIKTHHNRVAAIQKLITQGKVIEPLSSLYKDEVREVGLKLGLSEDLVWRHPFPGPGLAVRVLCSKEAFSPNLREIKGKVCTIAEEFSLKAEILPIKSVGVQGDSRTYTYPVALAGEADWETLEKVSTELTNRVPEVNRVVHLLGAKDFSTQMLRKKSSLTEKRVELLREVDFLANDVIQKSGLAKDIWQMPVILIPLSSDRLKESVVLRPVCSTDAMTASFAKLSSEVVCRLLNLITSIDEIEYVFYDITHKPPGTIEWE